MEVLRWGRPKQRLPLDRHTHTQAQGLENSKDFSLLGSLNRTPECVCACPGGGAVSGAPSSKTSMNPNLHESDPNLHEMAPKTSMNRPNGHHWV